LLRQGLLSPSNAERAHFVRDIGNEAAHGGLEAGAEVHRVLSHLKKILAELLGAADDQS
jgi:hypothetical protein